MTIPSNNTVSNNSSVEAVGEWARQEQDKIAVQKLKDNVLVSVNNRIVDFSNAAASTAGRVRIGG